MSTRVGGVSPEPRGMNLSFSVGDSETNVKKNRELFFGAMNIALHELALPRQVHSGTVKIVDCPGILTDCDALMTNRRRVFLCISVADCVPIMLCDKKRDVVAAVHAGWRGTAGKIVEQTIALLMSEFHSDPTDFVAFIGPSASSCCYNVGTEVADQFAEEFVRHDDGRLFLDLKKANAAQLIHAGVPKTSIEVSSLCTISEASLLHSYRREKEQSGRMMAVIGLV